MRKVIIFILSFIFVFFSIYLNSCVPNALSPSNILGPGGQLTGNPPLFAVNSFKMSGSNQQPLEISFGYYNNTFNPFKFINLGISPNFTLIPLNYSANFGNQLNGKKVIILGTGWKYSNDNASLKDIFWVGKIINDPISNNDIATISVGGNNFKVVGGRNFVARSNNGAPSSNFDLLTFSKIGGGNYNTNDFDNNNEDFRAVAFKSDGNGTIFSGSIAGRNTAFYSSNTLNNWQNAMDSQHPNKPSDFIAFDIIHGGASPASFILFGSDIGETRGEARFYSSFSNSWSVNYADGIASLIGIVNNFPFYSADYVSDSSDIDDINAAIISGKGIVFYWKDNGDNNFDFNDLFIFYINSSVTFYGTTLIKDANNNRFVTVGYDDVQNEAVIYSGIMQDLNSNKIIDNDPTKVTLDLLGLNLQDTMFFDVTSTRNFVFVVGTDFSNCNLKPYPNGALPKVTKSLIFGSTTNDADIIDTFNDMRGVILYSTDGGNNFNLLNLTVR